MRGADEECLRELRLEGVGVRHAPPAERGPAAQPRARPRLPVRRYQAPRPREAQHGQRHVGGTRRRADPRRCGEDEAANRVGTQHGGAKRDDTAERVADPHRVSGLLRVGDPEDGLCQRVDIAGLGQQLGAPMSRQVGNENAVLGRERRRERAPVLDRSAKAVHEDERLTGAADGITKPRSAPLELAVLESVQPVFAVCHH